MTTDVHEHPDDVPPRDPDPETEAGDDAAARDSDTSPGGGAASDGQDPSSPEAIENDPSTAGGPSGDVPDAVDRLRGG